MALLGFEPVGTDLTNVSYFRDLIRAIQDPETEFKGRKKFVRSQKICHPIRLKSNLCERENRFFDLRQKTPRTS